MYRAHPWTFNRCISILGLSRKCPRALSPTVFYLVQWFIHNGRLGYHHAVYGHDFIP